MIEGILVEGLVYAVLAIGVLVTFRVLDFPDLTVEGSFPAGAAAGAVLAAGGAPLPLALAAAFAVGCLAGTATAAVHHLLKVPPLLAGIVTMTALYSVDLRILGGRANLPLIARNPLMSLAESVPGLAPSVSAALVFGLLALGIVLLLDLFFHTEVGIALGALGDNEKAVVQAGADPAALRTLGVALANGLAGLAGFLAASYQGFADVNSGLGVVAAGLASVMIGELLFPTNRIGLQLLRAVLGSVLFRGLMYAGRSWGYLAGITPNDLRLLSALLIVGALAFARARRGAAGRKAYGKGAAGAGGRGGDAAPDASKPAGAAGAAAAAPAGEARP